MMMIDDFFVYLFIILPAIRGVTSADHTHFDVKVAEFHSHNDQPSTRKGRTSLQ